MSTPTRTTAKPPRPKSRPNHHPLPGKYVEDDERRRIESEILGVYTGIKLTTSPSEPQISPGSSVTSVITPSPTSTSDERETRGDSGGRKGRRKRKLPKSKVFVVRGGSVKGSALRGKEGGNRAAQFWENLVEDVSDEEVERRVRREGKESGNRKRKDTMYPGKIVGKEEKVEVNDFVGKERLQEVVQPQFGCIPMGRRRGIDVLSPQKSIRNSMLRVSLQCDDYIRFMMRNNSQYCLRHERRKRGKPKKLFRKLYRTFVKTFRT